MKTFKNLRSNINEGRSWIQRLGDLASKETEKSVQKSAPTTSSSNIDLGPKIPSTSTPTSNLPVPVKPQTSNVPVPVKPQTSNLPVPVKPQTSNVPVPVKPQTSNVPSARPTEPRQDYIPGERPSRPIVTRPGREGVTIDAKKVEPRSKTSVSRLAKPAVATTVAATTLTGSQGKKVVPTKPVQVGTLPPGGGKGGKSPFGGEPPGGGKGGKPLGGGNGASSRGVEADPNAPGGPGGFVTAGASIDKSGKLNRINVARGKVDAPAMPHNSTNFKEPLQKAKNVDYVKPQDWKQATSKEVTGTNLPPQGSVERDQKLSQMGYKKF